MINRIRSVVDSEYARPFVLIVVLFIVWELAIAVFKIPADLIPSPVDVAKTMVAEWPDLWRQSIVTGMATLGGIGYVLQIANGNFNLPLMFAALVILSLVAAHLGSGEKDRAADHALDSGVDIPLGSGGRDDRASGLDRGDLRRAAAASANAGDDGRP